MTDDNMVVFSPAQAGDDDPAQILNDLFTFLGRFVAYPVKEAQEAHALWIVHTHLMDAWESTPRIAFLSPEPGSGKTRALEVSELLVPNAVEAVNISPGYLFRKMGDESGRPTILYDEIDTVFGPKARDNEEIRGLLNAGHRRGAHAGRCVVKGSTITTEEIPAYAAVAMAGLGSLPDTLLNRSVIIRMRKRAPGERVEPYRRRAVAGEGHALRDRIARWAAGVESELGGAWPEMPPGIEDRDADIWESLIAISDAAGGGWPERARRAAVSLVSDSKRSTPSLGVRLLADIKQAMGGEAMPTVTLLERLNEMEDSPWGNLHGKPLDARGLSARLRKYDIQRKQIRIGSWTGKGYEPADFMDAWSRYLPPLPDKSETSETSETIAEKSEIPTPTMETVPETSGTQKETGFSHQSENVSDVSDVSDSGETEADPFAIPGFLDRRQPKRCERCGGPVNQDELGRSWLLDNGQPIHKGCVNYHGAA
jgi:hypothetical protein